MEEAFEAASAEINKGSKEKIKLSNVPFIEAAIGGAVVAIIGSIGGLLKNVFIRMKS